jgi:hypothetical protein
LLDGLRESRAASVRRGGPENQAPGNDDNFVVVEMVDDDQFRRFHPTLRVENIDGWLFRAAYVVTRFWLSGEPPLYAAPHFPETGELRKGFIQVGSLRSEAL